MESGTVEELFRSPKTEAARRLVFSGRAQIQEMNGKRLVRVTFKDKSSFEPVIANLVLTYRTPVNILYADTKNTGGAAEGRNDSAASRDRGNSRKNDRISAGNKYGSRGVEF